MEATFVVSEIEKLKSDNGYKYKDFAVLYRTNAQSRNFEEALRRAGIPYRIFGGLKFYDRKEIKDILAYLKIIVNPKDSISLRRIINVPKRSIGDTTVEKLQNHATEIDDTLYNVLLDVDYVPGLTARSINPIKKFTDMMEEIMVMSEQLSVSQLIEYVLEKNRLFKIT